jgi:hypothetical protein
MVRDSVFDDGGFGCAGRNRVSRDSLFRFPAGRHYPSDRLHRQCSSPEFGAGGWDSGLGKSRSHRHGGQPPAFDKPYALRHYKKYEESYEVLKELYY